MFSQLGVDQATSFYMFCASESSTIRAGKGQCSVSLQLYFNVHIYIYIFVYSKSLILSIMILVVKYLKTYVTCNMVKHM